MPKQNSKSSSCIVDGAPYRNENASISFGDEILEAA